MSDAPTQQESSTTETQRTTKEQKMQSKKTFLNITMAVILATSLNVFAQGPGGGGRGGQGQQPPKPAIDTALDVDADEVISADEIANAASALIELDADNDGELSFEECRGFSSGGCQQSPPAGRGGNDGNPPAPPIFSALDTSGDDVVDEYEIADAPESLLELDEDGDGQLQADEYQPQRPGGGTGGGPPRNR